jgi:hypothetical protein
MTLPAIEPVKSGLGFELDGSHRRRRARLIDDTHAAHPAITGHRPKKSTEGGALACQPIARPRRPSSAEF